jgi:transposase
MGGAAFRASQETQEQRIATTVMLIRKGITQAAIAKRFGTSTSAVEHYVRKAKDRGLL